MEQKTIRIGTRDSKLAMWQAYQVESQLKKLGLKTEIVPVKSPGDLDLSTPLHEFGTTGIFTKVLDVALLENRIDLAVHSLKDYPTQTPANLALPAVLERGPHQDILVHKGELSFLEDTQSKAVIATGSIRRIAQWKHRYPNHKSTNLRGNVQTRLRKLEESNWQGAIFAKAGLERIDLLPKNHVVLDWMIPAPAQGVIGLGCRDNHRDLIADLKKINHPETFLCAKIEREFLNKVEGGCSAPVGAFAYKQGENIHFHAAVFELDGSAKFEYKQVVALAEAERVAAIAANEVLANGAQQIMENLRNA